MATVEILGEDEKVICTVSLEGKTIPEIQAGLTKLQRAVAAQGWKIE